MGAVGNAALPVVGWAYEVHFEREQKGEVLLGRGVGFQEPVLSGQDERGPFALVTASGMRGTQKQQDPYLISRCRTAVHPPPSSRIGKSERTWNMTWGREVTWGAIAVNAIPGCEVDSRVRGIGGPLRLSTPT